MENVLIALKTVSQICSDGQSTDLALVEMQNEVMRKPTLALMESSCVELSIDKIETVSATVSRRTWLENREREKHSKLRAIH